MTPNSQNSEFLTVSELTDGIKESLNSEYPDVWVKAEISEITQAASGHYYLTLKDEFAQISAIIWRSNASKIKFIPEQGQEVLCRAFLDVYPQRGTYQLIIQQLQPVGQGALQLAFRQLHDRLKSEGLFDQEHKRELPQFPSRVAVVTSPTGAAIHDFLQVVKRRWPILDVTVVPTQVQGAGSAEQIAAAINLCSTTPIRTFDIVVLTRGGGSLEDLWSFNEEVVCRAIHECPIPVISAIGHEVDITLADLVADLRALTPTEAGERITPSLRETLDQISQLHAQMDRQVHQRVINYKQQLDNLVSRPAMQRPLEIIRHQQAEVDRLEQQLISTLPNRLKSTRQYLTEHQARIYRSISSMLPMARLRLAKLTEHTSMRKPLRMIESRRDEVTELGNRMNEACHTLMQQTRGLLETETTRLDAFNPLAVLSRGYSLTTNLQNVPVTDCQNVSVGDKIQTELEQGRLISRVEEIEEIKAE